MVLSDAAHPAADFFNTWRTYDAAFYDTTPAPIVGSAPDYDRATHQVAQLLPNPAYNLPGGTTEALLTLTTAADEGITLTSYGLVTPSELVDFGDAPDSYSTLVTANGPLHKIVDGLLLGATLDDEGNGQPSANADGDDLNGAVDDEDGVTLPATWIPGQNYTVPVAVTGSGFLDAWFDWNRDGDFLDAGEQVATNQAVSTGTTNLSVTAPATWVTSDPSYARFRLCAISGECSTPTGAATSGEVEDYRLTIVGDDFGDAVDATASTAQGNYNTRLADNGPHHTIVANLQLGANAPDGDSGALQNAAADADDTTNTGSPDDEDGVTALPVVRTISTSVALSVAVLNNTGADATVACWIDFNRDGDFLDPGERASALVPARRGSRRSI